MFGPTVDVLEPRVIFTCAQCGNEVKPKTQMTSDAPTVCPKCRCRHCGIVLSDAVCRCGARHGMRSAIDRLCERCHSLLELASQSESSVLLADLLFAADDTVADELLEHDEDDTLADELLEHEELDLNEDDEIEEDIEPAELLNELEEVHTRGSV